VTAWGTPRGLRATVSIAFAAGALVLSAGLAVGTFLSARHFLIEQRERTATRQAFTDAALLRDSLLTSGTRVSDVLGTITPPSGTVIYVHRHGRWYSSTLESRGAELTAEVRPVVEEGSVGLAWTDRTDPHAVVVGIPVPAVDAEYFEVSVAEELDRTLRTLALALVACAGVTTLAGALLGRAASRRVLAPLGKVTNAAVSVSAGDMSTRLGDTQDPDLVALVGAFNHMVDALQDRMERDARFAADVSHELRTPVTTLTTSLSLLQRTKDLSPTAQSAVELMGEELARFRRALEDLLALGRLDAGAHEEDMSTIVARELARQALLMSGRSTDLLAEETVPSSQPMVRVDRHQLLRALANLFENADLHGGGLSGVAVLDHGGVVDIRVEDTGPGVPAADRERIFERFARAGGTKIGTGSGLGLSIVQQTVGNHGGTVWCTDRSPVGGVFVVRLPTVPPAREGKA